MTRRAMGSGGESVYPFVQSNTSRSVVGSAMSTPAAYPSAAAEDARDARGAPVAEAETQGSSIRDAGTGQELRFLAENVQSLLSMERELDLLTELCYIQWDVLILSETWREKKQERWRSRNGHMFCGAGGTRGERGVAILLH